MDTHLNEVSTKAYMSTHGSLEVNLIADYPLTCPDNEQAVASRLSTHSPRSVLWSVSLASHTLNHPPTFSVSNSVTVRQAPFTAIESPTWQSPNIGAESLMTKVQPVSSWSMEETVPRCSI